MGQIRTVQTHPRRSGTSENGHTTARREQRLLTQLAVCTALFLTVLIGRSAFPAETARIREVVLTAMVSDTDFRGALTSLGGSVAESQDVLGQLELFCSEALGPDEADIPEPAGEIKPIEPVPPIAEQAVPEVSTEPVPSPTPVAEPAPAPQPVSLSEKRPSSVPAAGTVLLNVDYSGPELPARDTMNKLSLGDIQTATPVLGRQTSQYGWRTHPITGKQHFHGGADISGKMGAPIGAFADGTVDYIGRDKSYGLYIQLDHGNGVKSFYAHCSKLCADKGQKVKMGEKIAEIGSTGSSTGPHLHLELKCGTKRLNPAYYIRFTNA